MVANPRSYSAPFLFPFNATHNATHSTAWRSARAGLPLPGWKCVVGVFTVSYCNRTILSALRLVTEFPPGTLLSLGTERQCWFEMALVNHVVEKLKLGAHN